jgi:hypothetical protein
LFFQHLFGVSKRQQKRGSGPVSTGKAVFATTIISHYGNGGGEYVMFNKTAVRILKGEVCSLWVIILRRC